MKTTTAADSAAKGEALDSRATVRETLMATGGGIEAARAFCRAARICTPDCRIGELTASQRATLTAHLRRP